MITSEYMDQLKAKYINAKTEKEREEVRSLIQQACNEDAVSVAEIATEQLKDTIVKIDQILVRQQIEEILPMTSLAYIAKTYFNKSRQWLYQRINGNIVNGKQASFTKEEIDILNHALNDIGNRLINTRIV